jgi:KRAB domain-containing zinc finger protein
MSFPCDLCDKKYATYAGLYTHQRHHDPEYIPKFSCSGCDYSHDNISHLVRHQLMHAKKNEYINIITNVRKLYRQQSKYISMYKEKSNSFYCPECNKRYLYRQSLQVHIKTHEENRIFRFNCCNCDFKSDHKAHFGRHIENCQNKSISIKEN